MFGVRTIDALFWRISLELSDFDYRHCLFIVRFFGSVNFVSSAFVLLFDVVVIVVLFEVGLGLCIGFQSFTLTEKFLFLFQILTYINFSN